MVFRSDGRKGDENRFQRNRKSLPLSASEPGLVALHASLYCARSSLRDETSYGRRIKKRTEDRSQRYPPQQQKNIFVSHPTIVISPTYIGFYCQESKIHHDGHKLQTKKKNVRPVLSSRGGGGLFVGRRLVPSLDFSSHHSDYSAEWIFRIRQDDLTSRIVTE